MGLKRYEEPDDSDIPEEEWRIYVYKREELIEEYRLNKKSHYRLGRDEDMNDIVLGHESCSKQQAVLQFRANKLFVLDLESSNGTFLNGKRIEAKRFYQIESKDCLKFAYSTREYVILKAN